MLVRSLAVALLGLASSAGVAACSASQAPTTQASGAHGSPGDPSMHHEHSMHHPGTAHHRFDDAAAWAKEFESPERDAWQKGDAVVAALALQGTERMADIGAATGYFPVRFAHALPEGRIYAVDIEPDMVAWMKRRAEAERLGQIEALQGQPDDPLIPEPVDLIFLCNTYHHIADRTAYFERLHAVLKPGGRLVIVDFKKEPTPIGPPMAMRIAPEEVTAELAAAGYALRQRDDALLPYQHLLVYTAAAGADTP